MGLIDKNEAVLRLLEGTPVAVPTETVYGLAAPINNEQALRKIFSIKKRPFDDPLIVHVSSLKMAQSIVDSESDDFNLLAKHFWPGPLTLVFKKNSSLVSDLVTSSLDTVAVRCPNSKVLLEIIDKVGPLAAPSANIFKAVSPTKSEHVLKELPEAEVLKGEASTIGLESTIYDIVSQTILRPGSVTASEISEILNKEVTYSEKLKTPGSEKDHYQPKQSVWVFESDELLKNNATLAHSLMPLRTQYKEASKNLYQDLRDCDQKEKTIFVRFDPEWHQKEEWRAFTNRLLKASSKWFSIN